MSSSAGVQPTDVADRRERVLVACLGAEWVGVPVADVVEVLDAPRVDPLPLTPAAVAGQCAWRETWVPVFDPQALVGVARGDAGPGVVLILGGAAAPYGLWADDVHDVLDVEATAWRPVPTGVDRFGRVRGIVAVPEGLVTVVDVAALAVAVDATLQAEGAR